MYCVTLLKESQSAMSFGNNRRAKVMANSQERFVLSVTALGRVIRSSMVLGTMILASLTVGGCAGQSVEPKTAVPQVISVEQLSKDGLSFARALAFYSCKVDGTASNNHNHVGLITISRYVALLVQCDHLKSFKKGSDGFSKAIWDIVAIINKFVLDGSVELSIRKHCAAVEAAVVSLGIHYYAEEGSKNPIIVNLILSNKQTVSSAEDIGKRLAELGTKGSELVFVTKYGDCTNYENQGYFKVGERVNKKLAKAMFDMVEPLEDRAP